MDDLRGQLMNESTDEDSLSDMLTGARLALESLPCRCAPPVLCARCARLASLSSEGSRAGG